MTTFRDSNGNAVPVACADDPEAWFPTTGPQGRPGKHTEASARDHALRIAYLRSLCAACPVQEACLTEALRWDDEGFRGGLTEQERRAVRERRSGRGKPKGAAYSAALEAALADERAARAARRGAA